MLKSRQMVLNADHPQGLVGGCRLEVKPTPSCSHSSPRAYPGTRQIRGASELYRLNNGSARKASFQDGLSAAVHTVNSWDVTADQLLPSENPSNTNRAQLISNQNKVKPFFERWINNCKMLVYSITLRLAHIQSVILCRNTIHLFKILIRYP